MMLMTYSLRIVHHELKAGQFDHDFEYKVQIFLFAEQNMLALLQLLLFWVTIHYCEVTGKTC